MSERDKSKDYVRIEITRVQYHDSRSYGKHFANWIISPEKFEELMQSLFQRKDNLGELARTTFEEYKELPDFKFCEKCGRLLYLTNECLGCGK